MQDQFVQRVALLLNHEQLTRSDAFRQWCENVHEVLTPSEAAEMWDSGYGV